MKGTDGVYKLRFDCGKMGELTGLFVASDADVANAIGKTVYFGEVLGKHSEIFGPLEEGDVTLICDDLDDPDVVAMIEKYDLETGYNPLKYLMDD